MESILQQIIQLGVLKGQLVKAAMDVGDKINELHKERVHGCKHEFSKPIPGYEHEGGHCLHCGINEVYYLSNKDKFPKH